MRKKGSKTARKEKDEQFRKIKFTFLHVYTPGGVLSLQMLGSTPY